MYLHFGVWVVQDLYFRAELTQSFFFFFFSIFLFFILRFLAYHCFIFKVYPGVVGPHVHTIMGASAVTANSSSFSAKKDSICSSCYVMQDLSNYWVAALFFQHANGTMQAVPQVYPFS